MVGFLGLAIATSISAWVNVGRCWARLSARGPAASGHFVSKFARVLAASAVMAAVLVPASVYYRDLSRLFLAKEIAVLVVVGVGALCTASASCFSAP